MLGIEIDDAAEGALVESLIEDAVAGLVEEENLQLVPAAIHEDPEGARARVAAESFAEDAAETIEGAAEVDGLGGDEDASGDGDHASSSRARTRAARSVGDHGAKHVTDSLLFCELNSRFELAAKSAAPCATTVIGSCSDASSPNRS